MPETIYYGSTLSTTLAPTTAPTTTTLSPTTTLAPIIPAPESTDSLIPIWVWILIFIIILSLVGLFTYKAYTLGYLLEISKSNKKKTHN